MVVVVVVAAAAAAAAVAAAVAAVVVVVVYLTLHSHYQNDYCINMDSYEAVLMFH